MSRRIYLLGVGLALVALALAFTDWALSFQPGVTEANARRIRPGMTQEAVESLLGGKPYHGGRWVGMRAFAGPIQETDGHSLLERHDGDRSDEEVL